MFFTKNRLACVALALLSSTPALALQVPAGCAVPSTASPTRTLYVDPVKGSDSNSGAQASPWKSIQGSKIKPGDAILLMGGNYGDVKIDGLKLSAFATISPVTGQTPVLATLEILGSSHWIVQNVKVQSQPILATAYTPLVNVGGSAALGASSDIVLDGIKASSIDDASAWKQADWVAKARFYGIAVDGGDAKSSMAHCVAITNSTITNVRNGISATADDMLIKGNTLKNFGGDGFDYAGNRILIAGNRITDNHDLGDGNHNDAMQGQIGNGVGGTTVFDKVTIDGNTVIAAETAGLPFPGDMQGISAFNMDWSNLTVTNNVVVTNSFSGIGFYSVHVGLIANNTVRGTDPLVTTWLDVEDKSHEGTSSNNVTVRNNIADTMVLATTAAIPDHNLIGNMLVLGTQFLKAPGIYGDHNTVDAAKLATTFAGYDPHLLAGSPAIGAGLGGVDLGAVPYAVTPVPTPIPTPSSPGGFTITCKGTSVAKAYNCTEADTP